MKYEELPVVKKEEVEEKLRTLEGDELGAYLIGLSGIKDWKFAQSKYLIYINHKNEIYAKAAILGLSHLARISRKLDRKMVICNLRKLANKKPELWSDIEYTLEDIDIFVPSK